jgi:hypothetical protein
MNAYTPLKAGTGHKVHAGVVVREITKENRKYGQKVGKVYDSLCTLTNTHNINKSVKLFLLPEGTEITCEMCLARIAKEQEQEQGLQKFSEKLYASLFGGD